MIEKKTEKSRREKNKKKALISSSLSLLYCTYYPRRVDSRLNKTEHLASDRRRRTVRSIRERRHDKTVSGS